MTQPLSESIRPPKGAEEHVVRIVDHLAERGVLALAQGLLLPSARPGAIGTHVLVRELAVQLVCQRLLLRLRAPVHLVDREERESE